VPNCSRPLQNCGALVARNNIVGYSRPESLTSG
jgi:hypothetical protein